MTPGSRDKLCFLLAQLHSGRIDIPGQCAHLLLAKSCSTYSVTIPEQLCIVVHIQELIIDTFQLTSRKDSKQLPTDIKCFLDIAVIKVTL